MSAGGVGLIVINNEENDMTVMGASRDECGTTDVPNELAVLVSVGDGAELRSALRARSHLQAVLQLDDEEVRACQEGLRSSACRCMATRSKAGKKGPHAASH